jgi:hypothetical protein
MNRTDQLLTFDPLDAAEQVTGHSYKCDEGTGLIGLLLAMRHGEIKNQHLTELDDTTLSNDLDRYTRIITELGFELVLDVPFDAPGWNADDPVRPEHLFIYAHRDGLLLSFDTYDSVRVNGGKVYYCWKPNPDIDRWNCTSSGGMYKDEDGSTYWAGDHDCREALRHNLQKLRDNGTFLPQWPISNGIFLWLLHYQDTKSKDYDHKAITESRLAMLPDWVRLMIAR